MVSVCIAVIRDNIGSESLESLNHFLACVHTCHSPAPVMTLVTLAPYIVAVYVPTVRHRPDLVEAPRHLQDELHQRQRRHMSGASLDTV